MASKAERLLALFQGRTSEFAMGRVDPDAPGKVKLTYRPSGRPLTLADLEGHMDGSGPVVGVYVLREDSHVKFASFDIDQQDLLAAEKLRRVAGEMGFPDDAMMIVDSGNKGYHLHFFFEDWIPGAQARELLKAVCRGADIKEKELELFPKQPELGQHSPYGNLIKLPLVVHPASGRLAGIINARKVTPAPLRAVEAVVGASRAAVGSESPSPSPADTTALLGASGAVVEGGRNTYLTSLGGKLRRDGLAAAAIEATLLQFNATLCSPPLPEQEVRVIAQSVSRYPAGPGDTNLKPPPRRTPEPPEMGEVEGVERRGARGDVYIYKMGLYNSDREAGGTDWLIEQWLIRGQITVTVGQEKLGKSTQAWHRVAAISAGTPYWGGMATQKGRCLVMTEMTPETVQTLLDEDEIYPNWENVDLMLLDQYDAKNRLEKLRIALEGQGYAYCMLDPIDECVGLDAEGVWNSSSSSAAFDALRDMIRQNGGNLCIEGLYHFNKAGKVANSYKFTSKPDAVYELKGDSPAEITIKVRCRTRAIPKVRKITGNGADGYEVTVMEAMPVGRPSKRQKAVGDWMAGKGEVTAQQVAEGLGIDLEAARQVLRRMVRGGSVIKPKDGLFLYRGVSYTFTKTNSKPLYESGSTKKVTTLSYTPKEETPVRRVDETSQVVSYRTDLGWLIEEAARQAAL